MPWYFYLALKQIFPTGKAPSLFHVLSILGVMLGVGLLLIVQSVMGGFGEIYREKIIGVQGHLTVQGSRVLYERDIIENVLAAHEDVAAFTAYAFGPVQLTYQRRPLYPELRGYDLQTVGDVIPLDSYVVLGSLDELLYEDAIFLASGVARSLGARIGDTVLINTPLAIERLKRDEVLLPRELEIAGFYAVDFQDFDTRTAVVSLELMQDLYGLGSGVHGYLVRVGEGIDEAAVAAELNQDLPAPYVARTWRENFADLLWVLDLEKNMMFFLLIFIVVVAAFSIFCALYLSVIRKQREIGLLGALGGQPGGLIACYLIQGVGIGVVGSLLGLAFGATALAFRNPIIHWIAGLTGTRDTLVRFYQFSNLPAVIEPAQVALIVGTSLFLSILAGVLPAWHAARLRPAEALRAEA